MTVTKVYHIEKGLIAQFTDFEVAMAYVTCRDYEIYHIYCGGRNVVIIEVK